MQIATTGGGYFLMIGASELPYWEGVNPPSEGRVVEAVFRFNDPNDPATDYDRACDVEGYIAVLPVGAGEALILAEEIPEISLCLLGEGELPAILGWGWVGGEEAELRINSLTAAMIHALPWQEEPVVFTVTSSPLYVFDSAYEGTAMAELDGNYLTVSLPLGRYRVGRCLFEAVPPDSAPNGATQVGIYRFEPLPEI